MARRRLLVLKAVCALTLLALLAPGCQSSAYRVGATASVRGLQASIPQAISGTGSGGGYEGRMVYAHRDPAHPCLESGMDGKPLPNAEITVSTFSAVRTAELARSACVVLTAGQAVAAADFQYATDGSGNFTYHGEGFSPVTPKFVVGVNAHNNSNPGIYRADQAEAVFQLLNSRNLRSYRLDVGPDATTTATLDQLVLLSAKYHVAIRPMLFLYRQDVDVPAATAQNYAYQLAKRYAQSIPIWELGNELDQDPQFADVNTRQMKAMADGVKQAAAETGQPLKTSINFGASSTDPNGTLWFLDQAYQNGLKFDYLAYHYSPHADEGQATYDLYLGQMRKGAQKYGKKIFVNQSSCGEIYMGDNGDSSVCATSMSLFFEQLRTRHSDIVQEVNAYELFDQKNLGSDAGARFGLLFDLSQPKRIWEVLAAIATPG